MLRSTHTNRQPLAIMMLFMVLWQCLFVAVEAGAAVSPVADPHHPITHSENPNLDHPCADHPCFSHHVFETTDRHAFEATRHSTGGGDACDHCCACQGHGTHISIHVKGFSLEHRAPSFQPVATLQELPALYPPSIYRPPIR